MSGPVESDPTFAGCIAQCLICRTLLQIELHATAPIPDGYEFAVTCECGEVYWITSHKTAALAQPADPPEDLSTLRTLLARIGCALAILALIWFLWLTGWFAV